MATLKRDLGKLSGYATIIGILVGAGIFRVTGEAGAVAGSAVPWAYLLFAPIVISTALAYSVFISTPLGMRPGGAYIHISRTFGNYYLGFIAMWMKLLAFIGAISFMSTLELFERSSLISCIRFFVIVLLVRVNSKTGLNKFLF